MQRHGCACRLELEVCMTTVPPAYYIGVDIGGTFTDCVLVDSGGRHVTAKALSTKTDPVEGVRAALTRLGEQMGSDLPTMLTSTSGSTHGTTIGTNSVLERRGPRSRLSQTGGARGGRR